VKLVDAEDQQYDATLNDVAIGQSIGSDVKLGPGSSRKGYLVFSVPRKIKLAKSSSLSTAALLRRPPSAF
jgi:hypothetical protein